MSATAQLALDVRGFLAGMDLAKQAINNFRADSGKVDEGNGMDKLKVAAVGLAAGIAALGTAVYKGVQSTVELGARLVDVSYKSGLAVDQIMALERAMDEVGGKTEDVAPATAKFNSAIQQAAGNTGPLVNILQRAGLTMGQLSSMSVADRMNAVAAAIRGIQHPTEQAEAAMAVFGASGVKMVAALDPKNLNSAAAALGSQAQIMQANAGVFARIMQLMGAQGSSLNSLAVAVKGKLQGLFTGIAAGVAPTVLKIMEASATGGQNLANAIRQFSPALEPLAALVESLVNMDLAGVGAQLGAGAAAIVEAIMNGDAIAYLKAGLIVASDGFRQALAGITGGIAEAFSALFKDVDFASILAGFQAGMIGIGRLFLGIIEQGIAKILSNLRQSSSIFEKIISPEMVANIAGAAAGNLKAGREGIASGGQQIADATRAAVGQLSANIANVPAAFAEGRDAATAAESEATAAARATMADITARATATAAETAANMRQQFATPAAGAQPIALPQAAAATQQPIGAIVSSLAKIGGDIGGPRVNALDIQRAQLNAQQQTARNTQLIADRIRPQSTTGGNMVPVYQ
jgi:hypothetical protein